MPQATGVVGKQHTPKPSRRWAPVKPKGVGFEIPDTFVIRYGIDWAQRNRNLPYVGSVRFAG